MEHPRNERIPTPDDSAESLEALDLVCFSHLSWDFVYQRPQHLMTRFRQGQRVFYVEEPRALKGPSHWEVYRDNSLWVIVPYIDPDLGSLGWRAEHRKLVDQIMDAFGIRDYMLWYYTPMAVRATRHLDPALVVYDCMDELSAFHRASKDIPELESELLERADLVFTGGYSLYESKKDRHPRVYAFPSAIDLDHFVKARQQTSEPADQADIPHPRLGYFGVIDERMDLNLLAELANARPEWQIVMVGPVVKVEKENLPQRSNIHYLGQKEYSELPAYLSGWDAALMPFAMNDSTRYISPTKTPEYLAGGKQVVSTPIQDVVRGYGKPGLVRIAKNAAGFVKAIEAILDEDAEAQKLWLAKVDSHLDGISWDATQAQMKALIEAGLKTKVPSCAPDNLLEAETAATMASIPDTGGPSASYGKDRDGHAKGNGNGGTGSKLYSAAERASRKRSRPFDFLIVGAGFAGSVLAERLARGSGAKVLVIDRRNHIAGNAYDHHDRAGVMVHKYGPHIFHTNSREVFAYLSRFTEWRPYEHRVLASVDGQLVPMPINLDTINKLYGLNLTSFEIEKFFESVAEPVEKIKTSEDVVVSKVGRELYEKFFRNYTRKQWGLDPSELDATVTSRVPIRFNRDDRYFGDTFQSMPLYGYTKMFENLLDHPNIHIMLNTDYEEIEGRIPYRQMIFTGPVDEYFDYCYGKLPYRSLQFHFETLDEAQHQPVAVVNYPNEHAFTRVTEFKHLSGQVHPQTSLVYEYPCSEGDPYYPIPRPENNELYKKYKALADATTGVYFAGRLGTYRYYNMDQVTAQALTLYSKISGVKRLEALDEFTSARFQVDVPCPLLVGQVSD